MTKLKQYKFSSGKDIKHSDKTEIVSFFDPSKKYKKRQSFVIPNMASFIHDVSEHGNIGALKIRLFKLNIFQIIRLAWWNKFNLLSIAKKEFHAGVTMLIQIELLQILQYTPSTIIISDQINDLSYSLNNKNILIQSQNLIVQKLKLPFAVMTNNLTTAIKKLSQWKIVPEFIFTPINRFGYEMNPNQKMVEDSIEMVDPQRIVAITPELKQEDKEYLSKNGVERAMINWF